MLVLATIRYTYLVFFLHSGTCISMHSDWLDDLRIWPVYHVHWGKKLFWCCICDYVSRSLTRRYFFCYRKSRNVRKYPFRNVKKILILSENLFAIGAFSGYVYLLAFVKVVWQSSNFFIEDTTHVSSYVTLPIIC